MSEASKPTRHVCGISGGKDSAALAIYLKDVRKLTDVEYFFSDTGKELPEVYDFLDKLEAYLGREIVRIGSNKPFEHYLKLYGGFLPSPQQRWCTREMKIRPFEQWVGDDPVVTYVGIRADEAREGYISTKPNIRPVFPFKEDGLVEADIRRILENSVGMPAYYQWRSRSGCYFCFFQRRSEWLGLKRVHPDLFESAKQFEKASTGNQGGYTWVSGSTLEEISERAEKSESRGAAPLAAQSWQEKLAHPDLGEGPEIELEEGCNICHL
jgi:3'-phosphoadenosine 5'-phosphosulfate sulfotransferase (PAPS reductase)/FAD synthetase